MGLLKMRQISIGREGTWRHEEVEWVPLVLGQNSNLLESQILGWGALLALGVKAPELVYELSFLPRFLKKKKKVFLDSAG